MAMIAVRSPKCEGEKVVKRDKTAAGKQRYLCQNEACTNGSFIHDHSYLGRLPQVKQQIIDMSQNGSGVRDTARVLNITSTVLNELKKKKQSLNRFNVSNWILKACGF